MFAKHMLDKCISAALNLCIKRVATTLDINIISSLKKVKSIRISPTLIAMEDKSSLFSFVYSMIKNSLNRMIGNSEGIIPPLPAQS